MGRLKASPWRSSARFARCFGSPWGYSWRPSIHLLNQRGRSRHRAMKQLIVNADDFGLTKRVSEGIVEAHRHGIVSSTTLMANGGAFQAAAAMRRQAPHLG